MVMVVGISEKAVEYAVLVLSQKQKNFSLLDIAEFCGCHERTIKRAMPKLLQAGVIERVGSSRTGYRYTPGENHSYAHI